MKNFVMNFIILALCFSCARNQIVNSTINQIQGQGEGAILTVNLLTNQKIRLEQNCKLIIKKNDNKTYVLQLKNNENHYALNMQAGTYRIKKIHCGMFYYYDLTKYLSSFTLGSQEISYLGGFKLSLLEKRVLDLTTYAKGQREMKEQLESIGLLDESIILNPL